MSSTAGTVGSSVAEGVQVGVQAAVASTVAVGKGVSVGGAGVAPSGVAVTVGAAVGTCVGAVVGLAGGVGDEMGDSKELAGDWSKPLIAARSPPRRTAVNRTAIANQGANLSAALTSRRSHRNLSGFLISQIV